MTSLLSTEAYLLRSVAIGERDLMLTLFTRSRGKLSCIARGARASRKRFSGALEPLQRIQAELTHPEREISTLAEARVGHVWAGLHEKLERMEAAGRALRWVRHVLPPRVEEPAIWEELETLFSSLESADGTELASLYGFALELLQAVGIGISFERCGVCGKGRPPGKAGRVDVARGGVVCASCGGGGRAIDGAWLDDLQRGEAASARAVGLGLEWVDAALAVHTSYDEAKER